LSAAISNLLINAMQAGREVDVTASKADVDRLRVIVQDDGPGPPAEVADDLFEPFVTSKPEGLGLGLPLVARSAERLGGTVEWHRNAGKTQFVFHARLLPPRADKEVS
jgi:signal transduction histidine kinase